MDRKSPQNAEIERLIRLSAESRECLGTAAARLKRQLDIPARIRGSVGSHPLAWFSGSLATGLLASLLLRHRRPAAKSRRPGIGGALLGLTLTAARPLAKLWFSNQVTQWLGAAASAPAPIAGRPVPRPLPGSPFP